MVSPSSFPFISVVIVNYNGINFIESCLRSVLASNYSDLEIIFVDNASTDDSLDLVRQKFGSEPNIKIIANKVGLGPSKGRNIGIGNSKGKYIAFLDNDTEVDKDWLKEPLLLFESDPTIGAAQGKLLLSDRKTIDTCGHYLNITGFPYEIGSGELDSGQYNEVMDIFGARSAAMFIRRSVLDQIGYFDPDYFMHSEETDLSWRMWLNNYRVVYVPKSIVYHKRGGSIGNSQHNIVFYEGPKNCIKTLIKNLEFKNLIFILPLHILAWISLAILFLFKGRMLDVNAIVKGIWWDVVNIKKIIADRKKVQSMRTVKDEQIFPVIMGNYATYTLLKKGIKWLKRL